MSQRAKNAAVAYIKDNCGINDVEATEVRPDPNVDQCYAVRLRVQDDDRVVLLLNFMYGDGADAVFDECRLEDDQKSLDDVPVGSPRFI